MLLEESVIGWKEFEMEVVRDRKDNCIIVCSIENFDPMGVHTGDSITVAPAQTLTDKEYQRMRDASIAVLRKIGVDTGGSNVQFAVNPADGRLLIIEMNPRVSRSSALASKATGFPIAKIAAKLAVGYTLDELKNDITGGATPASFEPTIDYVVTKIPRFTFEKFPAANDRLTTQMKSVGRGHGDRPHLPGIPAEGACAGSRRASTGSTSRSTLPLSEEAANTLAYELRSPGANRLLYVADAFRAGWSLRAHRRADAHRSVVPRAHRGSGARGGARARAGPGRSQCGAHARAQAQGLLGQPPRAAHRRVGEGRAHAPPRARRPPGLQARRHLRRRVRDLHGLPLFDVRGGVRGAAHRSHARS